MRPCGPFPHSGRNASVALLYRLTGRNVKTCDYPD
jgi:hypothetical protein